MDYSRPRLADRLASEYVTGTLRGRARTRFENLLPAHPALKRAVAEWQDRLMPLTIGVAEVAPREHVWRNIEARIGGAAAAQPSASSGAAGQRVAGGWGFGSLRMWRGATAFASVAAIALALAITNAPPDQPPLLVVLSAPAAGTTAALPSFVASLSGDGRALVTRPIVPVSMQVDRTLELWALPEQGPPRSLGLISSNGTTALRRDQVLKDTKALAVSLEPPGGSPTGAPTGPVLFSGALTS